MSCKVISINVSTGLYKSFINTIIGYTQDNSSRYVCVANVHMLIEAHRSNEFASVVNNADMVTPDGMPLTWAMRLLYGLKQDRVAGMDLLPDLLKIAAGNQVPIYFYGGTDAMLGKTKDYLDTSYPSIPVAGMYSPPFRPLTADEEKEVVNKINNSGAKIVFVVLGCPKQEKWMASMKGKVNAVMIGIGGALPVLIGMQERAPGWMQRNGLEWLFRLSQEPGRLFKRYAVTNSYFIYLVMKELAFNKPKVERAQ